MNKLNCLVLAFGLISISGYIDASSVDIEEFNRIYDELFSLKSLSLNPNQVTERLEWAIKVYKQLDGNLKDKYSKLSELLKVNDLIKVECDYNNFKPIEILIERYRQSGTHNIIPYLEHIYTKLSRNFKDKFPLISSSCESYDDSDRLFENGDNPSKIESESEPKYSNPLANEWVNIYKFLYRSNGPPLEPNQILELLRRADYIFNELKLNQVTFSEDAQYVAAQMSDLLKASQSIELGWKYSTLSLGRLFDRKRLKSVHIDAYVEYLRDKHLTSCVQDYIRDLTRVIRGLSPEVKQNGELLWRHVELTKAAYVIDKRIRIVPESNYFGGLFDYFEAKASQSGLNASMQSDEPANIFRHEIEKVCKPIEQASKSITNNIYSSLIRDEKALAKMSYLSALWTSISKVCVHFIDNPEEAIRKFKIRYPQPEEAEEKVPSKKVKGFSAFLEKTKKTLNI